MDFENSQIPETLRDILLSSQLSPYSRDIPRKMLARAFFDIIVFGGQASVNMQEMALIVKFRG